MPKKRQIVAKNGHHTTNFSPNIPYKALEEFLEIFQREYGVDLSSVKKALRKEAEPKEVFIPVSVFNTKLSTLETVTKYLKENLQLKYHEIAELLNRDDRTIWTTYHNSQRKMKRVLRVKETKYWIPVSILADRRLSPLEAVVVYLNGLGLRYYEIARLLKRDQRNIWTVHNRAKKKWKKN